MIPNSVLVLGGTGFIGSHLVQRLAAANLRVVVPTRKPAHGAALRLLPTAEIVVADVYDTSTLCNLLTGIDAVVNLVGVLHSESDVPYGPEFARAHVELPRTLVAAAHLSEVSRIVHVSALGADVHGPSEYLRSKGDGENLICNIGAGIEWTVFRPSVVFGPDDSFLNLFAQLVRRLPVLPLGGAHTRFQPVFVEDVVSAIEHALLRREGIGEILELAGPRVRTLADIVRYVAATTGHHCPVLPLPDTLAMLQAAIMEYMPGPPMSRDNLRSMRVDSVASASPLPFGLTPTAMETVAPAWLREPRNPFSRLRHVARHS